MVQADGWISPFLTMGFVLNKLRILESSISRIGTVPRLGELQHCQFGPTGSTTGLVQNEVSVTERNSGIQTVCGQRAAVEGGVLGG